MASYKDCKVGQVWSLRSNCQHYNECDTVTITKAEGVLVKADMDNGLPIHETNDCIVTCLDKLISEGTETMSTITNPVEALLAKAQGIDADTKTLREAGLEATDGRMTANGQTALLGRLWQENRTKIAADLRELEAEGTATTSSASV